MLRKMVPIPPMIYGTAWKSSSTTSLVLQALSSGFRGIDTAAQPKHYQEDLVGAGIRSFLSFNPTIHRSDLYIQTKFTSISGQDPARMPYQADSSLEDQVHASIASSLHNLRHCDSDSEPDSQTGYNHDKGKGTREGEGKEAYLDCVLLHSPFPDFSHTLRVWRVLESYVTKGSIRSLGISNIYSLSALEELYDAVGLKPAVVQNRFYRDADYCNDIRKFCARHGMVFQSFWTLTANPDLVRSKPVERLARDVGVEREAALYNLLIRLGGFCVLNGTTKEERMRRDLESLWLVDEWVERNPGGLEEMLVELRRLLRE